MKSKTKQELIQHLSLLRQQIRELKPLVLKHKHVKDALQESEEVLRLLFEQSSYATVLIEDGRFIDCNEAALKMLGWSEKPAFMSLSPSDISPERQADGELSSEKAARILEKVATNGSNRFLWIHKKTDETQIYVDVMLMPIKIKGRKIIYTIWNDITAQKGAEEALKKSERLLADIIDFLPDATCVFDLEGKAITWNRAMEKLSGIPKNEMIGHGDYSHTVPFYGERRKHLLDLIDCVDKETESKYQNVRKEGNVIYGEAFAPCLNEGRGAYIRMAGSLLYDTDGKRIGAIESIRDINDSKLAEEALKKSEERFRTLVDHAPFGISLINGNDDVEYINPRFTEIFGYTLADIVNTQIRLEKVKTDPDDNAQTDYLARKGIIEGTLKDRPLVRTVKVECKDKKEKIINTRTKFLDSGFQLVFYEDITEQRSIEAQLRQANKIEAIGTLAAGIAHDFNNILGGMNGYTEMSLLRLGEGNSALKEYLKEIKIGIRRATDLVKQILTFSRQGDQEIRAIRVIPILKETLKLIRAAIPTYIDIIYKIKASQDLILADPSCIHQVLMNLCANAAHAMQEKGGVLHLEIANYYVYERGCVSVDLKAGGYLLITVSDTGPGIDSAICDRIFDPFFTTKKPGEGTGLGLSVVHGIVKNLGGEIIVRSHPGEGTTFEIYLPLMEAENDIAEHNLEISFVGGKERILFVDDEEKIAHVAEEMLEEMGYDTLATTSSLAALEAFRLQPDRFDIVITDLSMPDMTGMELAAEMLKIRPEMPIIVCTGLRESVHRSHAKISNIEAFIMKPFTMAELDTTIRKVLLRKI